jgi:hypothetical protein
VGGEFVYEMSLLADHGSIYSVFCQESQKQIDVEVVGMVYEGSKRGGEGGILSYFRLSRMGDFAAMYMFTANILVMKCDLVLQCFSLLLVPTC